jgi:hypothetical protein
MLLLKRLMPRVTMLCRNCEAEDRVVCVKAWDLVPASLVRPMRQQPQVDRTARRFGNLSALLFQTGCCPGKAEERYYFQRNPITFSIEQYDACPAFQPWSQDVSCLPLKIIHLCLPLFRLRRARIVFDRAAMTSRRRRADRSPDDHSNEKGRHKRRCDLLKIHDPRAQPGNAASLRGTMSVR